MIVKTQKKVPSLRFPGFEGEWPENVLGEIATFSKGKGISKAELEDNGSLECITYGELYTRYTELIDEVKSKTNLDPDTLVLSDPNDVIIPASGETHIDIATASCVLHGGIALGGDLNIIKTENHGVFLAYYLNNARKKDIASLAQGSSVIHLYSTQLKSLKLFLPSPDEQQKIAAFLTAIDTRIQQLTRKVDLLEQYKKGVMQQIFSQEIRFKDDQGREFPAWEEKRIKEFAPLQRGFDLPVSKIVDGDYPVVFSNGILKTHNEFKVKAPGVVTGRSGTIGKVTFVEKDYWPHNTTLWVTDFKGNDPRFAYCFYERLKLERFGTGSGVPTLNRNDVHSQRIFIPSLPEQQKIAAFLTAIDRKITYAKGQLEHMQRFKKGLLQQMFV